MKKKQIQTKARAYKRLLAKSIFLILTMVTANVLYAQDEAARKFIETDTVEPCRARNKEIYRAVSAIDAMPLGCDSVFIDEPDDYGNGRKHFYIGKRLFFDHKNRLRKYRTYKQESDGASDYMIYRAYYDEKGQLIYFDYNVGNNCEDFDAYCALRKGIVAEYDDNYYCGCCEDEDEDQGQDTVGVEKLGLQKVGKPLKHNIEDEWYILSSFSDARTLLKVLDIYKYPYYEDISEFNSKEYCFAYVIDEKEKTGELKNDTITLSYRETRNNQVADRKCKIVFTCDANRRVQKCVIDRYMVIKNSVEESEKTTVYYDEKGNLFYIQYFTHSSLTNNYEEMGFFLEDGVISFCPSFLNKSREDMDDEDREVSERLKRSFVGKKLNEVPCKNANLADYATTERLKKTVEALKKGYAKL